MQLKKTTLILLLVIVSYTAFGQSSMYVSGNNFVGEFTVNASSRKSSPFVKGSPYYNKDFMFGELLLQDGKKLKGLFRYNIYDQDLELIVKKDTLIITDPTRIKVLEFGGKSFIYSLILDDNNKRDFISGAYFEVIKDGPTKLLIKREINMRENRYVAHYGGGGGDGSQRFIPEKTYYLKLSDDGPAFKIKKSKKSISKLMDDYKSQIKDYISDHKLNLSKDSDLIKVIEYYNELKQS